MKVKETIEVDVSALHDVVVGVLFKKNIKDFTITDALLERLYFRLPLQIRSIAFSWGCNDTVFRDEAYSHLLEHWDPKEK